MDVWEDGNHAPTINLPDTFAFDRNGSLTVDFTPYVSDADSDPLTLGYSGNTNVLVEISGLNVSFTAAQNWTGSETITFSVYDGHTYAYDVVVTSTRPGPADARRLSQFSTIHGIVASTQCQPITTWSALGQRCRIADVVVDGGNAYVTLVVNLAADGEAISFKIYDYSANLVYDASETYTLGFGEVIGTTASPVPISVIEITELDTPVITGITKIDGGFSITWNAVDNADYYEVWRSTDPYGTYEMVGSNITGLMYSDLTELPAFYYIKAIKTNMKNLIIAIMLVLLSLPLVAGWTQYYFSLNS